MTDKKYNIDGSDILIIRNKEYTIFFDGQKLINSVNGLKGIGGKPFLKELQNLILNQAISISDRLDISFKTVEYVLRDLENNDLRHHEAGYYGLYDKQLKDILEAIK